MTTPSPTPPCFAPKGFYCTDQRALELCPESWYCRGGLLLPAKCPDAKWSPAGAKYLAECGDSTMTELSVIVAIIIVFAGLSLCMWAYIDSAKVFAVYTSPRDSRKTVCVYDESAILPVPCTPAAARWPTGRSPVRYFLVPRTAPPV